MLNPSNEILVSLTTLFNKGQYLEAEKLAINITNNFPNNQLSWKVLGLLWRSNNKLIESLYAFKKAVSLHSQDADAFNNLGALQKDLGLLQDAEASLKQAIEINTQYSDAYYNLGNVLNLQGKKNEAKSNYLICIKLNPNHFEAIMNLGVTLVETKKFESSVDIFKRAISLNPNYCLPYNYLGNSYIQLGSINKALCILTDAIQRKSDYDEAWNNIYYPIHIIYSSKLHCNKKLSTFFYKKLKINKLRLSLLKYKLHLGREEAKVYLEKVENALSLDGNNEIKNPYFSNLIENKKERLPEKIISLIHFGRSGTGLLHSLIDNHSQVSTIPSFYFSEFFDPATWKNITKDGWSNITDRFISYYPVFFDARKSHPVDSINKSKIEHLGITEGMTELGENRKNFLSVEKEKFKKELDFLISQHQYLDQYIFFKLVHVAYEKTIRKVYNYKKNIFYHIHNPDVCARLNFIRKASHDKWIVMVRDPVDSCESWSCEYFVNNDYYEIVMNIKTMLYEIDNIALSDRDTIGLRLEDLKQKPKKTIKSLSKWMEIKEENTLYEMTAQGEKWWGDRSSPNSEAFGKLSRKKIGKVFSETDRLILNTLFYPFNKRFGYTLESDKKFKDNLEKIYPMMNRLFDFEKEIAKRLKIDFINFMKLGHYRYLRTVLKDRWYILKKNNTYPNMIKPLIIK